MAEVTLLSALSRIEASAIRERSEGLQDLKHVLRHNQRSSKVDTLGDASFHRIFEVLFRVAVTEKSTFLKAKTPTTRSAAESRLSTCASSLRLAIEVGVKSLKLKTIRALLDHLMQTMSLPAGGFCEPLALDYAKSLSSLLTFQPHVEHLSCADWERTTTFCLENLSTPKDVDDEDEEHDGQVLRSTNGTNGQSYRSSRSHVKDSIGSQGVRSVAKQVSEELVGVLRLLTAAPNAPFASQGPSLLKGLIHFLRKTTMASRTHQESFAAANHVLHWSTTEAVKLTQEVTTDLLRLIRHFWSTKSNSLKDEMLTTMILLQPFVSHMMQQSTTATLRIELNGLLEIMSKEYSKRLHRDQLSLDDLRLELATNRRPSNAEVATPLFSLKCHGDRVENSWALVYIMASLSREVFKSELHQTLSDDDVDNESRPRKRQRLTSEFDDVLDATVTGSSSARAAHLQLLAFQVQQDTFTMKRLAKSIDKLVVSAAAEHGEVSSWALLAVAGCAAQMSSKDQGLSERWSNMWQLATRAMSTPSTCRSACFFLSIAMKLRLVEQPMIDDFTQRVAISVDLNGPATLSDCALRLMADVLHASHNSNTALATSLADATLSWLLRRFTPSRYEDRQYTLNSNACAAGDVLLALGACINQNGVVSDNSSQFHQWDSVARCWLQARESHALISYLLLLPVHPPNLRELIERPLDQQHAPPTKASNISCEGLLLNHLCSEVARTNETWMRCTQERSRAISSDMFSSVCTSLFVCLWLSTCFKFHDERRQSDLVDRSEELLETTVIFASSSACTQEKVDILLHIFYPAFSSMSKKQNSKDGKILSFEQKLCTSVYKIFQGQRRAQDSLDADEDDMIDLDQAQGSQGSRRGDTSNATSVLKNDREVFHSVGSLRATSEVYTTVVHMLWSSSDDEQAANHVSPQFVNFLLSFSQTNFIEARDVLAKLPEFGLQLDCADTERLFESLTDNILSVYAFERSEVALGTILDLMSSMTATWADPKNPDLFALGVDMYSWYTTTALSAGVLSPNVQQRVATLLLQLCDVDTDYGRDEDVPSVRTSLFKLLQQGSISVQYHLAGKISTIFARFTLSFHEAMFDDLKESLPADADWTEGIALRLLFLAKLASAWHSLVRRCIYYIFETAGRVKHSTLYAARCVEQVAHALAFDSPRKIFALFAPQLLHTWLEEHSVSSLPFGAFQYLSLAELLRDNESEITAQLIMRKADDGMHAVSSALKSPEKAIVERSFGKTFAYAISWDVVNNETEGSEAHLRSRLGSKEDIRDLAKQTFPVTAAQLFLSMQQDEAELEKQLGKKIEYADALKALREIKGYSHSEKKVFTNQQPSFKSKYILDQMGRLCKRTSLDIASPWDPSTFTLSMRIVLAAIEEALGSLHTCTMIRKIRTLICMAGDVATSGFPLDTLLHSLHPFLRDSQCADDTLGIIRFLLTHGRKDLEKRPTFLVGTTTLTMLAIKSHMISKHASTTQESQHQATVQKMQDFEGWLVKYLQDFAVCIEKSSISRYRGLIESLKGAHLPGNGILGTPESTLLIRLLHERHDENPLLDPSDCMEAVKMLAVNFRRPALSSEDHLGADKASAQHAAVLWPALVNPDLDSEFHLWAAVAIGRAYASTGTRPIASSPSKAIPQAVEVQAAGVAKSHACVAHQLSTAQFSRDRLLANLADHVLRRIVIGFRQANDVEGVIAFESMLPASVPPAITYGTFGYHPLGTVSEPLSRVTREDISRALNDTEAAFKDWSIRLAVTLCRWAAKIAILAPLPTILKADGTMARRILPSILHILLSSEVDREPIVRSELSAAMHTVFVCRDDELRDRQTFMLEVVLYLRTMPFPGERTKVDRAGWLDIDYMAAADCASRCYMPASALLLAETATSTSSKGSRRVSSKASMSQLPPEPVSDCLLLAIFKQIDEPDSFYGVQQSSSLASVLERLDYEGDGLKSLMFRSAQMDSHMQSTHNSTSAQGVGVVQSMASLGLSSVTFALLSGNFGQPASSNQMLSAAKKLQQWDVTTPEATRGATISTSFRALQEVSRATQLAPLKGVLEKDLIRSLLNRQLEQRGSTVPQTFLPTLAVLTELTEVLGVSSERQARDLWTRMTSRQDWMQLSKFEDFEELATNRPTLFSALGQNRSILSAIHVTPKTCRELQVKALLSVSRLARRNGRLQDALAAATHVSDLASSCSDMGLYIDAAAKSEVAKVLWRHGETAASVSLLREVLSTKNLDKQTVPVGRSGIMAQVGHQLANARLEKPEAIMDQYLKSAIEHLGSQREGQEAGEVFFEFANFCDQQLQNPDNLEDFSRIARIREQKEAEVLDLEKLAKAARKGQEKHSLQREADKARQWFSLDDAEYQRLRKSREVFTQQSLQNYLHALHASDEHNICALRFFALWLENDDMVDANNIVHTHLPSVASWKFVLLTNQLMSRLKNEASTFQKALSGLIFRICAEHPYHSLHHLFAATRYSRNKKDAAMVSRVGAAQAVRERLQAMESKQLIMHNWFNADRMYYQLALYELENNRKGNKVSLNSVEPAALIAKELPRLRLPPPTISVPLKPNGGYDNVPTFTRVSSTILVMSGLSTPMVLTITSSDGKQHRALFKSGNDDLRQDAIMEQVFEEASKMLQNHKATRQRNLHIRTYKVIPLSTDSGIIEFVPNSIPINEYLKPAHAKYYPSDIKDDQARMRIREVEKQAVGTRLSTFRKIIDQLHPVMRHFFLERFDDPDEWFQKRTAYTRTTAAISILGYVLGLGDRHCHNILLDEKEGDVIHIDLGVAFEAGRVLPIPENVPFRLTRDIVDGMGVTQTEGVFRRCCEFTMDALREDKDSIMTLLNVLRYDPLYAWSVSTLRAKRMQDAAEDTNAAGGVARAGGAVKGGSTGKQQEAGEAERALSVVEKKLSKTLSTSATVNELIQQATDEKNLATLFAGWSPYY